jgi:hypothetical protein
MNESDEPPKKENLGPPGGKPEIDETALTPNKSNAAKELQTDTDVNTWLTRYLWFLLCENSERRELVASYLIRIASAHLDNGDDLAAWQAVQAAGTWLDQLDQGGRS